MGFIEMIKILLLCSFLFLICNLIQRSILFSASYPSYKLSPWNIISWTILCLSVILLLIDTINDARIHDYVAINPFEMDLFQKRFVYFAIIITVMIGIAKLRFGSKVEEWQKYEEISMDLAAQENLKREFEN